MFSFKLSLVTLLRDGKTIQMQQNRSAPANIPYSNNDCMTIKCIVFSNNKAVFRISLRHTNITYI